MTTNRERKRVTEAGMRAFEKGRKHNEVRLPRRERRMRARSRRRRRKVQFLSFVRKDGEEKWKKNATDKRMTANPTLTVGKVSIH